MSEKRCYTVKEIQEILDVSRPTVYALLKAIKWEMIEKNPCTYATVPKHKSHL